MFTFFFPSLLIIDFAVTFMCRPNGLWTPFAEHFNSCITTCWEIGYLRFAMLKFLLNQRSRIWIPMSYKSVTGSLLPLAEYYVKKLKRRKPYLALSELVSRVKSAMAEDPSLQKEMKFHNPPPLKQFSNSISKLSAFFSIIDSSQSGFLYLLYMILLVRVKQMSAVIFHSCPDFANMFGPNMSATNSWIHPIHSKNRVNTRQRHSIRWWKHNCTQLRL